MLLQVLEADFKVVAAAVRELLYLRNRQTEVNIKTSKPRVYVGNQSTLKILSNNRSSSRIKHIAIVLQFINESKDLNFCWRLIKVAILEVIEV